MCRPGLYFPTLLVLALAGCGRVDRLPTAVTPSAGSVTSAATTAAVHSNGEANFYPLVVGNRWEYAGRSSSVIISASGRDEKHGGWTRKALLARTETINGRSYLREEDEWRDTASPTGPYPTIRWVRQDRTGLYELGTAPPQAPPFTETRLLAYPLHAGATWVMTEYPHTTATVEGMDVRKSPAGRIPAWRIRVRNVGQLPQEELFVWYGRAGYLGRRSHVEFGKQAPSGRLEMIQDESDSLTGLTVSRREP